MFGLESVTSTVARLPLCVIGWPYLLSEKVDELSHPRHPLQLHLVVLQCLEHFVRARQHEHLHNSGQADGSRSRSSTSSNSGTGHILSRPRLSYALDHLKL